MRSLFCYFVAALTLLYNMLPVSSVDKKSDLSDFASAINSAGRLRYGKRSSDYGYPLSAFNEPVEFEDPYARMVFEKRAPITSKLIQSLNEAERLRFGRK
ncbi:hypothetical protein V3C99_014660 [Haemonchus contortus]|uniref:Short neuropeptide F n=1 Tax=Haemonchus contortus TaxID=6289 RepID=A0A7I4YU05_HAECO